MGLKLRFRDDEHDSPKPRFMAVREAVAGRHPVDEEGQKRILEGLVGDRVAETTAAKCAWEFIVRVSIFAREIQQTLLALIFYRIKRSRSCGHLNPYSFIHSALADE